MKRSLWPTRQRGPDIRLRMAFFALTMLLVVGTVGYMFVSGLTLLDALYHTVITVSTVGYAETAPQDTPQEKLFTIGIILLAAVVVTWGVSSAAELLFTGQFWTYVGRQRMQRRIDRLEKHTIVCGYGRMGRQVVEELTAEDQPWVVIDTDRDKVNGLHGEGGLVLQGDATHDDLLLKAGVERARALISVVRADAENIVTVLSARALNPEIQIGARAEDSDAVGKLYRAGANYVLQHHATAAMHLALSVTHPVVEDVLNLLIPRQGHLDLGQLLVTEDSRLADRTLAALDVGRFEALVIAIYHDGDLTVPPKADTPLRPGDVLVIVGTSGALNALRDHTGGRVIAADSGPAEVGIG